MSPSSLFTLLVVHTDLKDIQLLSLAIDFPTKKSAAQFGISVHTLVFFFVCILLCIPVTQGCTISAFACRLNP
jgi:hypothetical protein